MRAKMITLGSCTTKMLKRTTASIAEIHILLLAWPNLNPYKTNKKTKVVTVSTQSVLQISECLGEKH
jgi:glycine cleavage system protein P-like pyridoxal-binding family